jgi:hypothetical protein
MASIQRVKSKLTGDISYRVQVRVKNRPSLSETFSSEAAAKKWAKRTEVAIEDGKHFPHLRSQRTSFADVAQRYRESA